MLSRVFRKKQKSYTYQLCNCMEEKLAIMLRFNFHRALPILVRLSVRFAVKRLCSIPSSCHSIEPLEEKLHFSCSLRLFALSHACTIFTPYERVPSEASRSIIVGYELRSVRSKTLLEIILFWSQRI